ncbi:unnamed protein product [Pleuronectes platessa]|uniref:Uncharacterized protein n=1 Tax=Pleuronectes platessa TaxID=8262 RepID=A0A9N7TL47_PLEPL|nr:unnamed protein product [Pleuronectes platessa]
MDMRVLSLSAARASPAPTRHHHSPPTTTTTTTCERLRSIDAARTLPRLSPLLCRVSIGYNRPLCATVSPHSRADEETQQCCPGKAPAFREKGNYHVSEREDATVPGSD